MLHTFVAPTNHDAVAYTGGSSCAANNIELSPSGLKARANLAWGEAPGHDQPMRCGLNVRAKLLVPDKLFVERNTVLREHRPHLGLKIALFVVRSLTIDISDQCRTVAQADRERRRPALPTELRKLRPLRLDPFRRRDLQSLNHLRDRFGSGKKQRDVNVIDNTANAHTIALRAIENRSKIGMHLGSNFVLQKWTPAFGTEDKMDKNVRERLRHDSKYSAGLQPANMAPTLTWGYAPGYDNAGLQSAVPLPIKTEF